MRLLLVLALLSPTIALGASCALAGFNRVDENAGAQGGADADAGPNCEHASYPAPPSIPFAGGDRDLVFALHSLRFDHQPDGGPVGLDLDETCTCQGQGSSCVATDDASVCDQAGGRDNVASKLFAFLGLAMGGKDLASLYSDMANAGGWSLLIRVRDYNGEPDDDQVRVAWYISPGTVLAPLWQGVDEWQVSNKSIGVGSDGGPDLDSPITEDERAYVTGGVLVSGFPSADLVLTGGQLSWIAITMTEGAVMGRLDPPGDAGAPADGGDAGDAGSAPIWRLSDGLLVSRVAVGDLFRTLSSFRNTNGEPICTSDGIYPTAKNALCEMPDILTTYGLPNHPCDAISVGIAFVAEQAVLGLVVQALPPTPGCADPAKDPASDHCP